MWVVKIFPKRKVYYGIGCSSFNLCVCVCVCFACSFVVLFLSFWLDTKILPSWLVLCCCWRFLAEAQAVAGLRRQLSFVEEAASDGHGEVCQRLEEICSLQFGHVASVFPKHWLVFLTRPQFFYVTWELWWEQKNCRPGHRQAGIGSRYVPCEVTVDEIAEVMESETWLFKESVDQTDTKRIQLSRMKL